MKRPAALAVVLGLVAACSRNPNPKDYKFPPPELAARAAQMMRARWRVEELIVTNLSGTIGSQLGPGAVGIGVAPVARQ